MRTVVVYVHGLWLHGGESFLLRRRLSRALDAETRVFPYASVRAGIAANALALGSYLRRIDADTLHVVAHSMGGLVLLRMFDIGFGATEGAADVAALPPGRVVLTGSPVRGSRSAMRLARLPVGRVLLGRSAAEVLLVRQDPRWRGGRELGVIAGDLCVGLGRLLGRMEAPNDGTVWVDETVLPGSSDQLLVPVSHTGLVFSRTVARQTATFLREGRFER